MRTACPKRLTRAAPAMEAVFLCPPCRARAVRYTSLGHGFDAQSLPRHEPFPRAGLGRHAHLARRLHQGRPRPVRPAGWARTPGKESLYTICVLRAARSDRLEVYHWGLRDRIPAFRVPLRAEDEDVALDLQPLVDRAYELGYYWQDNPQTARLHPGSRRRKPPSPRSASAPPGCSAARGMGDLGGRGMAPSQPAVAALALAKPSPCRETDPPGPSGLDPVAER